MRGCAKVSVIIPAFNEEKAIGNVISAIPGWVDETIVVDNGSTDGTAAIAASSGARVISETRRGYGSACLSGIASLEETDIIVFLDGDFSDYPEEMDRLVDPIVSGQADMVIGSRVLGTSESGALTVQARFGNWLSCLLIRVLWELEYTDLGPFRAIRYPALKRLDMRDPNYGWTVEMQIKAARVRLRSIEVPVSYRKRIGKSKISGTLKGTVLAGTKILYIIFRSALDFKPSKQR
jgi:glycosyltransferase involved in cell wall biosynthesis